MQRTHRSSRVLLNFPVLGRVVFDMGGHPAGQVVAGDVMGCGGFYSSETTKFAVGDGTTALPPLNRGAPGGAYRPRAL
jgi:hypothetical protein